MTVVIFEMFQFPLQIDSIAEEDSIKVHTVNDAEGSLDDTGSYQGDKSHHLSFQTFRTARYS